MSPKLAFASFSLGTAHSLKLKLQIAKKHGYKGIEITYEELQQSADEIESARSIRQLCSAHDMDVVCLQFTNLQTEDITYWCLLAEELGTDMIQICWYLPMAVDVAKLKHATCRVAIEGLCWGPLDCWQKALEVVETVNLPNVGLCLDVYHIAGQQDPDLSRLASLDSTKVFYVQLADGMAPTIPRRAWSNQRLFYGEGLLPILDILKAMDYDGWISLELFNPKTAVVGDHIVEELASRGRTGWDRLLEDLTAKE